MIPRLELLSAVITAKLYSTVRKALTNQWKIDDENCQFWFDSKTVLFWIKGSGEYKQFVANRVHQILKLTSPNSWRFCPGSLNPADLGTRGVSPTELRDNALWWNGPPFLQKNPDQWPEDITDIEPNEENIKEMKHSDPLASNTLKTTVNHVKVVIEGKLNLKNVIDVSKYSDAEKLYRITALVMPFINNLGVKSKQRPGILLLENLSAKELSKAEQLWMKECQRHIQGTRNYVNLQRELKLFEDHKGIIHCRGRLANAELPYDTKYPIFLPREKYSVVLMVLAAHERVFHGKTNQTLVELRQRFWITRG